MTEKCGCCNNSKKYSNVCKNRGCKGTICKNCNYCNICYNCNCHRFPGHFMLVQRLECKNSCTTLDYSFHIGKLKCHN